MLAKLFKKTIQLNTLGSELWLSRLFAAYLEPSKLEPVN